MVTIQITMSDTGQISVSAPLENIVLCYGLIEAAKDTIREHAATMAKRAITPATAPTCAR